MPNTIEEVYHTVKLPESFIEGMSANCYGLRMADDAMDGIINKGDISIVDLDKPINNGDIIVAFHNIDGLIIRRLDFDFLKAYNRNFADIPIENVKILGRIILSVRIYN